MERLLDKKVLTNKILLKDILNAFKQKKKKDKPMLESLNKSTQSKITKSLTPKLKPRKEKFESHKDKVKKNKKISLQAKRKPQGFKVKEPKNNHIDRDTGKYNTMKALNLNFDFQISSDDSSMFLLDDEDEWHRLIRYYVNDEYGKFNNGLMKYFPYRLMDYIKHKYYIINYNKNQKAIIPVFYTLWDQSNSDLLAYLNYTSDFQNGRVENLQIEGIYLSSALMIRPDRVIDYVIAHELAHAKRLLEDRVKIKDNDLVEKHEEFWTDREIKKMLPIVNPKYNDKNERRKTLYIAQEMNKNRNKRTGKFNKLGEFFDRFFPFHNN